MRESEYVALIEFHIGKLSGFLTGVKFNALTVVLANELLVQSADYANTIQSKLSEYREWLQKEGR